MSVERKASEEWDRSIENTLVKTGYGTLVGFATAVLLFRAPASRSAVTALGSGIGFGYSIKEAELRFSAAEAAAKAVKIKPLSDSDIALAKSSKDV